MRRLRGGTDATSYHSDIHRQPKTAGWIEGGAGRPASRVAEPVDTNFFYIVKNIGGWAGFCRTIVRLYNTEIGFDPTNVLTAGVNPPAAYDTGRRTLLAQRLLGELHSLSIVDAVAFSSGLPMVGGGSNGIRLEQSDVGVETDRRIVSSDYFKTLRIPILRGRTFSPNEGVGSPGVAVVSAEFVRRFLPREDPIGRRFEIVRGPHATPPTGTHWTIVGAASDVRQGSPGGEMRPTFYVSSDQVPGVALTVVARIHGQVDGAASGRGW